MGFSDGYLEIEITSRHTSRSPRAGISAPADADHVVAFEHQPVAINVDLALADDQPRGRCALHLPCLLPQDVIARAGTWFSLHHPECHKHQQCDCSSAIRFLASCHLGQNARSKSCVGLHVPTINPFRAVAQLGRAPGSGPGGRGFKSHQPDSTSDREGTVERSPRR